MKSPRPQRPKSARPLFPTRFGPDWFSQEHPSAREGELPADAGCWSESAFMTSASSDPLGFIRPAHCSSAEWSWLGFALLGAESEHIRRTAGAWNHEIVALGLWDEGDSAHTQSESPSRQWDRRFRPALVMPWYEGDDLGSLSKKQRRAVFPRMLPALWDALLVARHGDLSPQNLRLLHAREAFVLLDPGADLSSPGTSTGIKTDRLGLMVTNVQTYPLLHPYALSVMPATSASAPHELTAQLAISHTMAAATGWLTAKPLPRPGPPPADWLAVAVMYFVILTGRHPFYHGRFDAPAWAGARTGLLTWTPHPRSVTNDPDFPRWAERARDMLASTKTITDAERCLAASLLSLSFTTKEQLLAALAPLADAR